MEEVVVTDKQQFLKENYPFGSVPKLNDKFRCLFANRLLPTAGLLFKGT